MKAPCHRLCIACYLMIQLIDIIGHEIFLLADLIVLLLMDHNFQWFENLQQAVRVLVHGIPHLLMIHLGILVVVQHFLDHL